MRNLSELRTEAEESTGFRQHPELNWSAPWHGERASIQHGSCDTCGLEVQICTNPMPNGIDIGGEAVALNCGDKSWRAQP